MGKGADAQITVGADADAATRAAALVKTAWRDAGQAITSSIGSAAQSVATDYANIALAQGKVSLSSQHAQVREFEAATARMAIASGRDLESVRSQAEATGVAIGKRPQEVIAWTNEVGKLTYNFDGASKSIGGFAALAARTNRSVDDYRGLAVELGTIGHVAGDSSHALGVMTAQAEILGTSGGPAAFADQVLALEDTISHFAVKSEADFLRITAAAGALGKGLNQAAAQRVEQRALGFLSSNVLAHERYLGHRITDDKGQVEKPMETLLELRDKVQRQYGNRSRMMLAAMFGDMETANAVLHLKKSDVDAAANAKPSKANEDALKKYLGSDAGGRDVAGAELAKSSRDLMGSSTKLGRAADALQQFASHNPLTSTFVATALGTGMSAFMSNWGGTLAKIMGGKGEGGAVRGIIDLATKGTGLAPVLGKLGVAGAIVGAGIYGIHKWEDAAKERHDLQEKARESAADSGLQNKVTAIRRTNEASHHLKGLSALEESEARNAATKVVTGKDALAALQFSHGGGDALKQLVATLHAQNKGMSDADAAKIAQAFVTALQASDALKVQVANASDTPITAAKKNQHSHHAGHQ